MLAKSKAKLTSKRQHSDKALVSAAALSYRLEDRVTNYSGKLLIESNGLPSHR